MVWYGMGLFCFVWSGSGKEGKNSVLEVGVVQLRSM